MERKGKERKGKERKLERLVTKDASEHDSRQRPRRQLHPQCWRQPHASSAAADTCCKLCQTILCHTPECTLHQNISCTRTAIRQHPPSQHRPERRRLSARHFGCGITAEGLEPICWDSAERCTQLTGSDHVGAADEQLAATAATAAIEVRLCEAVHSLPTATMSAARR